MARFDRCRICDYSEAEGSGIAGVSPGRYGRVRRWKDDALCDKCMTNIKDTFAEYFTEEKSS
jgi:rubredoxin